MMDRTVSGAKIRLTLLGKGLVLESGACHHEEERKEHYWPDSHVYQILAG